LPRWGFCVRVRGIEPVRDGPGQPLPALKTLLSYTRYLKPHVGLLAAGLVLSLIFGASSGFGIPAVFEKVFKPVIESGQAAYGTWEVVGLCLLLPGIFLLRGVTGFLGAYWLNMAGMYVLRGLQQDLFAKFQALSLAFYDRHKTGDLIARITHDTAVIHVLLLEIASESIRQSAQLLAAVAFLIYLSFRNEDAVFLLLFLAVLPVLLLPVRLIRKKLKQRGRELQDAQAGMTDHFSETFGAIPEIRAFGLEPRQSERFAERIERLVRTQIRVVKYQKTQQPLMELIAVCCVSLVFAYALLSEMAVETFTAMGLALYFGLDPARRLFNLVNNINKSQGAFDRLEEIFGLRETITDAPDAQPVGRLEGRITLSGVSFAYGTEKVLRDIDVDIAPGTICAIVGPSGAGKSTFAKLLPRFYEVSEGTLAFDGRDVRSLRIEELRRNIAIVPQQTVLFNDTIRENIRLGRPEATDAEVEEAARKAFAHEFVQQLPERYDTLVGERGDRLSGGQKQRISLARAFLREAPILILDEPTSALDATSERYIQQAMDALMKDKTVLIIAHRLSTIRHADRILVLEAGRLVADAPHEALLAQSSHYRELVENQTL
jgi:subfamily B ATP-binding cassette protein MsbA